MIFTRYYTPNSWDFGFGIGFPSKGDAIDGVVTIRPRMVVFMFGPWTWELETNGRADVCYDKKEKEVS